MSFDYIFWILFLCLLTWNFIFMINAAVQYLKREKAWLKDKEQRKKEAIKHLTGKDE